MKLVMMSCRYVVIYKCIVSSPPYKENAWFPWEFTNGDAVRGLTQYVLLCMV